MKYRIGDDTVIQVVHPIESQGGVTARLECNKGEFRPSAFFLHQSSITPLHVTGVRINETEQLVQDLPGRGIPAALLQEALHHANLLNMVARFDSVEFDFFNMSAEKVVLRGLFLGQYERTSEPPKFARVHYPMTLAPKVYPYPDKERGILAGVPAAAKKAISLMPKCVMCEKRYPKNRFSDIPNVCKTCHCGVVG